MESYNQYVVPPWDAVKPTALVGVGCRGVNRDFALNLGDDVQTEAAARLYGDLPIVDRCDPSTWEPSDAVVMCHWFGDPFWDKCGDKPTKAEVFLIGTHFSPFVSKSIARLKEWLKYVVKLQGFPAFCRDIYSRNFLRSLGVDAEFGGCVTQTLQIRLDTTRRDRLCVDAHSLPGYKVISNKTTTRGLDFYDRRSTVVDYLNALESAAHVITSRLHALLPCRAFSTPVTLAREDWTYECRRRFSGHVEPTDVEDPPAPEDCRIQLCNGMVDRIGQLFSFRIKSEIRERSALVVSSPVDVACNGDLLSMFESVRGVLEVHGVINGPCIRDKWESIYYDREAAMAQAADELRLNSDVSEDVRATMDTMGSSFVAVHVRRTDKMFCWSRPMMRDLSSFFGTLDGSTTPIYLATDSEDVQKVFMERYGARVNIRRRIVNTPGQLRSTSLMDAVVDLAVCTAAPSFEGDPCSGWFRLITAFRNSGQTLIGPRRMVSDDRKALSFSLYGDSPLYRRGILENAKLARDVYNGWDVVVHTDVKDLDDELMSAGVTVINRETSVGHAGMRWRYETVDPYDVVCFRDADSRISSRERKLVDLWLDSVRGVHVMRDHEHHKAKPIQGGMWGVRTARFNVPAIIGRDYGTAYGSDEDVLARVLWPVIKHDCLVHDNTRTRAVGAHAFPKLPPPTAENPHIGARIRT